VKTKNAMGEEKKNQLKDIYCFVILW